MKRVGYGLGAVIGIGFLIVSVARLLFGNGWLS
jgi:hypothetical protein